ncbi:succinate dehydrogenase cytochrome b560 subunit [Lasallia pustulata]|nr:succinate dehydrogenase cytochrome b560 subunit [Lasallia pustulata]
MSVQRFTTQSMRRFAAQQPGAFSRTAVSQIAAPAAIATSHHRMQTRTAATQPLQAADPQQILATQRRHRPISPHLSIYRPQITWYGSALNRITGCILSGGFYVFGAAYLVAPLAGWHLESASLAAAFGAWPVAAKVAAKFAVAWPFAFHGFNGLRHLAWDTGRSISNLAVQRTGWAVVGASVVGAGVLAYL